MCVRAHVHVVGDGGGPTNPFAILSCCALVLFRLAKVNYASARFCVPASCSFSEADEAFGRHSCVLVSHTIYTIHTERPQSQPEHERVFSRKT